MGWRKKNFQKKKISNRNPYARELEEGQYRQRIKESDKEYTRKKIKVKDVYQYDEPSD